MAYGRITQKQQEILDYIKNEILNVSDDDFSDWEGHMNGELAEQFSEVLTDILKKDDCSEYFYSSYDECIEAIKARGNE